MPIHDWSKVDACIFHDFHQAWTVELCHALNDGALPTGVFALIANSAADRNRRMGGLKLIDSKPPIPAAISTTESPPQARFIMSDERYTYASLSNRLVVRHRDDGILAVIEIVSPGNKCGRSTLRWFVGEMTELLRQGINLLVVDLFPPSARDPQGSHKAIWDEIQEEPFELPADKPLTVAAYAAAAPRMAYVEPVAVGDALPSLPIFLEPGIYVPAPLETSYQTTWSKCPLEVRELAKGSPPAR